MRSCNPSKEHYPIELRANNDRKIVCVLKFVAVISTVGNRNKLGWQILEIEVWMDIYLILSAILLQPLILIYI